MSAEFVLQIFSDAGGRVHVTTSWVIDFEAKLLLTDFVFATADL